MSSPVSDGNALEGAARPTGIRWRLILLLMLISFMNHFNRISMTAAGKQMIRDATFSEEDMGWIYAILLYAYTLFMTPGGWLADRFGGRFALSVVGLGAGATALLTGLSLQAFTAGTMLFASLLLVRSLMGACIAPIYPGSGAVVSHWMPFRARALSMGLITGAAPLGIASAIVFCPDLIKWLGLSEMFFTLGVATVALALVWLWYSRNDPLEHSGTNDAERALITGSQGPPLARIDQPEEHREISTQPAGSHGWSKLLSNRSLWLITVSYGALGYMEYVQFYWADYYFTDVLGYTGIKGTIACVAPLLLMCITMPLGGWFSDLLHPVLGYRRSRAVVAGLGMVGSAGALAAATLTDNSLGVVVGFAISLGMIGMSEGPCWATAIDLGKEHGGLSAGIFNTGGNGFGALGPIVTPGFKSWLLARFAMPTIVAWGWSLRLASLICFAGAILWLWIDPGEEQRE